MPSVVRCRGWWSRNWADKSTHGHYPNHHLLKMEIEVFVSASSSFHVKNIWSHLLSYCGPQLFMFSSPFPSLPLPLRCDGPHGGRWTLCHHCVFCSSCGWTRVYEGSYAYFSLLYFFQIQIKLYFVLEVFQKCHLKNLTTYVHLTLVVENWEKPAEVC